MRVSIIRVSRDTGVYYYPPWGDANPAYNTVATHVISLHACTAIAIAICSCNY